MSYPVPPQQPGQPGAPVPPQPAPNYLTPAPQAPSYPVQPPRVQPAPMRPALPTTMAATNAFAVVAVILAFIQPIAGIVFGHIALSQIKRNGDSGRGLALTGLVLGYIYVAFLILFMVFYVSMIAIMIGSLSAAFSELNSMDFESY